MLFKGLGAFVSFRDPGFRIPPEIVRRFEGERRKSLPKIRASNRTVTVFVWGLSFAKGEGQVVDFQETPSRCFVELWSSHV